MDTAPATKKLDTLSKETILKLAACAGLAAFWVFFLWNFFERGVYALVLNAFVFLSLFLGLFLWVLREKKRHSAYDITWVIPFCLITISFFIYDNPFLKITSILAFPALFAIFYNYAFLDGKQARYWNSVFLAKILSRVVSLAVAAGRSAMLYLEMIIPAGQVKRKIIAKVIIGLAVFLAFALTVFIPLLSSADAAFADKIQVIYDWAREIFSTVFVNKILTFIILSLVISAALFVWTKNFDYEDGTK